MEKQIENKRTYTDKDGNRLVDMCIPSIKLTDIHVSGISRLNQEHNGRLDKFVYTCVNKDMETSMDAVMYVNHIFNPFAVQEGDIMYVPITNDGMYYKQSEPELPDGEILSNKQNVEKQMTYAERVDYYSKLGMGVY